MATVDIPLTVVSVQAAKPGTAYGALAVMPLKGTNPLSRILLRCTFAGIPANAVVSSAVIRITQHVKGTGSVTIGADPNTSSWSTKTTWNGRPGLLSTYVGLQTRVDAPAGSLWEIPVTDAAQRFVAGDLVNNGFTLRSGSGTAGTFRGHTAAAGRPVLRVEYSTSPIVPTGLHPSGGGVVSKTKPTLTFTTPSDTVAIQVQVDPAGNGSAPAFDSGVVVTNAGLFDLSTSAYSGLSSGSTQWRARAQNSLGWSDWSGWASFARVPWGTLTVTSPSSTTEDPSPPISGSYSGVATSWDAYLKDELGRQVATSGWRAGSNIEYASGASVGGSGAAIIDVRDDVANRVSTPGDPDYLRVEQTFLVQPSNSPAVVDGFTATQRRNRPWVVLSGTRANVPDEVAIYRNGQMIQRLPGLSAFDGLSMEVVDYTAPMNVPLEYSCRAIVNGSWSAESPVRSLVPRTQGIWLVDPATGDDVVLLGLDGVEQEQPEVAIVHVPLQPDAKVVRRRLARSPRQGSVAGRLIDALGSKAADNESRLGDWAESDAGRIYRLVLGNRNDPVILGDITLEEDPMNGDERILQASFNWWRA